MPHLYSPTTDRRLSAGFLNIYEQQTTGFNGSTNRPCGDVSTPPNHSSTIAGLQSITRVLSTKGPYLYLSLSEIQILGSYEVLHTCTPDRHD
jgi:hypothetical protein